MKITLLLSVVLSMVLLVACQKETTIPVDTITTKLDVHTDPVFDLIMKLTETLAEGIVIRPHKSESISTKEVALQIHCESGTCLETIPSLLRPYQQQANLICQDVEVAMCCCMTTGVNQCFDFRLSPQNACEQKEEINTIPPTEIKMVPLDSII